MTDLEKREAFETWLKSLNENGRTTYFLGQESTIAWEAWQARVPEGYVVVPVEIRDEIESAMFSSVARGEMPCDIYKSMIEAAVENQP